MVKQSSPSSLPSKKGKEEELSVHFRVDFHFFYFLVLFSGFESANCVETSRAGLLVLLFFLSIIAWKFMKSRKISGIHFFLVLLQFIVVVRDRPSIS